VLSVNNIVSYTSYTVEAIPQQRYDKNAQYKLTINLDKISNGLGLDKKKLTNQFQHHNLFLILLAVALLDLVHTNTSEI
jgi:hypothetical protein